MAGLSPVKPAEKSFAVFMITHPVIFSGWLYSTGNSEFIIYSVTMMALIGSTPRIGSTWNTKASRGRSWPAATGV